MENQHNQHLVDWEIELREDLNQYEFEYEATAWNGMEELLNTPISKTTIEETVSFSTFKMLTIIGISSLLIWSIIGFILFNHQIDNNTHTPQEDKPLPLEEKTSDLNPPIKKDSIQVIKEPVDVLTISQAQESNLIEETPVSSEVIDEIVEKRETPKVFFLPRLKLKFLERPITDSSMMNIQLIKRKRNRRTLFPDVIEH